MTRRPVLCPFLAGFLLLALSATPSFAQPDPNDACTLGDAVVLATNSVHIKSSSVVVIGDVVVDDASPGPTLEPGYEINLARASSVVGNLKADSVQLERNAVFNGTVFANEFNNKGATGTFSHVAPLSLPVFTLPPAQQAVVRPEAEDVTVLPGETRTLAEGDYGDITVGSTGTVKFAGGLYNVRSLTGGQSSAVKFQAATEVRIEGRLTIGKDSVVGPSTGGSAAPSTIVIYVNGANAIPGDLLAQPSAVDVGRDSQVSANVHAANGTLNIGQGTTATGAFLGRDVVVERNSTLQRDSAFVNKPPVANPQEVLTNGAASIVITLTGSDPEGDSLAFAITAAPSAGTLGGLSPIVPAPVEDPNNPGTFVQPPVTSATVTYTPTTPGANAADSFSFSVTDGCGKVGIGVIKINPPVVCDDGTQPPCNQPPEPTAVDAIDVFAETTTDTPRTVGLQAVAPSGVVITFSVLTLPSNGGGLQTSGGTAIETVPFALPDNQVIYTPPTGFAGSETFNFQAQGTGGVPNIDTAVVTIATAPQARLAGGDQSVETPLNQPLQVSLIANPGGAGSVLAPMTVGGISTKAFPGAAIAGNVSDANDDGFGDGRDNLPGPAPVLVAAGVDVNLGASPSGSVTDPAGDATNSTSDDPANPDLVSATVASDGVNLTFTVHFVAAGFSASTSRGSFVLDTDENPATGFPGIDAANNDSALMGVEFLVNIGANLGANAEVLKFISPPNNFSTVGTFTATVLSDGYSVSIPLSAFDGDDGRLTFKVETQSFLGPGFTGILDYMPNVGLAPGQSRTGIQGVARVQIEWNVSTLPAADEVESATVILNTQKGTVDDLDTFFFAGTADQDGLLLVSDFEAPMTPIPGVVMPVPAVPTGTDGTFSFNVTGELKAALARGDDFFSVQGRVDEDEFAGGGFRRGLQVRSTATGNLATGKEPKLEVVTTGTPTGPALTFEILSLPSFGTLKTVAGSTVFVGQTFTASTSLLYTPAVGVSGDTSFSYRVTEGFLADIAIINIRVLLDDGCAAVGRPPGCSPNAP